MNRATHSARVASTAVLAVCLAVWMGTSKAAPAPARAAAANAVNDTLKRVADSKTLRLGYREASIPFSYVDSDGQPRGYAVELCQKTAGAIAQQLKIKDLRLEWVKVTPNDRVTQLKSGAIDLECGSTTASISRQAEVDFSLLTFADGAALLARAEGGSTRIADLAGRKVAVVPGTTTEKAIKGALARAGVAAELVSVKDHAEGAAAVAQKRADAYASDRVILIGLALGSGRSEFWRLPEELYSYEPYALSMRRNDADFRLAVNRELARLYRSGEIDAIYTRWFQSFGEAGPLLKSLYFLNGLPE